MNRLIFGGSFDPPHQGHFKLIKYVLKQDIAEYLDIIPAALSPFKLERKPVSSGLRFEMLKIGINANLEIGEKKRVRILDIEIRRPAPSYTFSTCRLLKQEFPDAAIGLLVGSDALKGFTAWKNIEEIFRYHPIVVLIRNGDSISDLQRWIRQFDKSFSNFRPQFRILNNPRVHCSSTRIRNIISASFSLNNKSIGRKTELRDCLVNPVREFIKQHGLYKR